MRGVKPDGTPVCFAARVDNLPKTDASVHTIVGAVPVRLLARGRRRHTTTTGCCRSPQEGRRLTLGTEPMRIFEVTVAGPANSSALNEAVRRAFANPAASAGLDGPLPVVRQQLLDLSAHDVPEEGYERHKQELLDEAKQERPQGIAQWVRLGPDCLRWLVVVPATTFDSTSCRLLWQAVVQQCPDAAQREAGASTLQPVQPIFPSAQQLSACRQAYQASPSYEHDKVFWEQLSPSSAKRHRYYNDPPSPRSPDQTAAAWTVERRVTLSAPHLAQIGGNRGTQGRAEATEPFFTAVLLAVLWRLSAEEEHCVGVPVRRGPALFQGALGAWTQWAAIEFSLESSQRFEQLVQHAAARREAFSEHAGALPIGAEALPTPEEGPGFDATCCVWASPPVGLAQCEVREALSELPDEALAPNCQPAVHVSAFWNEQGNSCRLRFRFSPDRIGRGDANRFAQHFVRLLTAANKQPAAELSDLPIVDEKEKRELLALNPKPSTPGPDPYAAFEQWVSTHPSNPAIVHRSTELSYGQLNARVQGFSRSLNRQGLVAGDRLAVVLERGVDLVALLLACLKLRVAYIPLDPSHPASRNGLVLEVAQPKVMVTQASLPEELRQLALCPVVLIEELHSTGQSNAPRPPATTPPLQSKEALSRAPEEEEEGCEDETGVGDCSDDPIAYILFTSGSTGTPKGVEVPRSALANFLGAMRDEPGFSPSDSLLSVTTISFDIAELELLLPLSSGGWLEVLDRLDAFDPKVLKAKLNSGRFTTLQATPATWRLLIESGWDGAPELKALCGGEAMPPALASTLTERTGQLWNLYGPTETTVWSTVECVTKPEEGISVGRPIANTLVYVLDDHMGLVPQGVVGEIVIGGLGVARGYSQRPDLTAEKFLRDPFAASPGGKMYRTGDLGRWLENGKLQCLGRVDFQVKIRGFRIELGEIEAAIAQHETLKEAIVVAYCPAGTDPQLVAYGKASEGFDPSELRAYLRDQLPPYMVPAFYVPVEQWPLTGNGKIDRKNLPPPQDHHAAGNTDAYEAPQSPLEQRVAEVWGELFQEPKVSRSENLFASGKSSLDAIRLLSALAQMPEGEVPLGEFLSNPTVAGIAEVMQREDAQDRAAIVALNAAESGATPVYCICGLHLYSEMALAMPDVPVFGVYLPLEGHLLDPSADAEHLPKLQDIAKSYVDRIVHHNRTGPYRLVGLSIGGVVAFEMARQLKDQGKEVELLALIDSILPQAEHFSWGNWLMDHKRQVQEQGLRYVAEHPGIRRKLERLREVPLRVLGRETEAAQPQDEVSRQAEEQRWAEQRERQVEAFDEITRRYAPNMRVQKGGALFFRAEDDPVGAGQRIEPDGGFGQLMTGSVAVHSVAGDHLSILQGDSAVFIASRLTEALGIDSNISPTNVRQSG